jgi:hypothetical protein
MTLESLAARVGQGVIDRPAPLRFQTATSPRSSASDPNVTALSPWTLKMRSDGALPLVASAINVRPSAAKV